MVTKIRRVGKATVTELQPGIAEIETYLKYERVVSLSNTFFPFPLATA
jgi:hypothetical protein